MQKYLEWATICNLRWFLPVVFVVLALPSTILFTFLTPPFQVPDEAQHYFYARSISLGQFLPKQFNNGEAGGIVTTTDQNLRKAFQGIPFKPDVKVTREMLDSAAVLPPGPIVPQNYWGSAIYPPSAYAVPAAALFLLNHLGLNPLDMFFGGRFANAVIYVLVGALAIWLTPAGKFAFAFVLLLPMALSQAGSFSADVQVFSFTALICALLARDAVLESPAIPSLVVAAALLILVATAKAPMIALALPLAAISWRRSKLLAIVLTSAVIAGFVLWTVYFVLTESSVARVAAVGASTSEQMSFLIHHPLSIIDIAFNTIKLMWWRYIYGIIGIFGWLDTPLSRNFYRLVMLFSVIMIVTVALERKVNYNIVFAISSIASVALTFGALYLSWSKVGADIVSGVQGRYFIPILFPAVLALPGLAGRFRLQPVAGLVSFFIVLILWITSSAYVPLVLVDRFYLH